MAPDTVRAARARLLAINGYAGLDATDARARYRADLALVADARVQEVAVLRARLVTLEAATIERETTLAHAIFWLLRAYQSGTREGWEPGPSSKETMDGLWTWLCDEGFDPNDDATPQFVPEILRLRALQAEAGT